MLWEHPLLAAYGRSRAFFDKSFEDFCAFTVCTRRDVGALKFGGSSSANMALNCRLILPLTASVAWRGVAWRGVVWRGVAWRGVVWRGVVWCGVVWCGVARAMLCAVM